MTEYSHQNKIFALNSIANVASNRLGKAPELEVQAKELINKILNNSDIISLIGKWKLVWGPKIYERKGFKIVNVADNAMYVAQSMSDPNQYVVAISGTNPISAFGWIVEDADIFPPIAWPYGKEGASVGNITNGTNVGMNALLKDLEDNCKTLFKFLADQVSDSRNHLSITVTGHSLGGALSPVTALALADSQGVSLDEPNGWDPKSTSHISVMPTAGPTPGDEVWRDYYEKSSIKKTDRVWNKLDIVPHAWQISMLNKIPSIYKPTIVLPPEKPLNIRGLVTKSINLSQKFEEKGGSKLVQICPSVPGLPGKVCPSRKKFLEQAGYQHTTAYSELLGTTKFDKIVQHIKEANEPKAGCGCLPWM